MEYPNIELEKELKNSGFEFVVGLDEAGRGPWAGPVSAGAVVLNDNFEMLNGVTDSKKVSAKNRDRLFDEIQNSVKAYGVGLVSPEEIDIFGISKSVNLAMQRAVLQVEEMLGKKVSYLIADGGTTQISEYPQRKINKGDLFHYSISAASILAKVTRDRIMEQYAIEYPEYSFGKHVGYGTKLHAEILNEIGPCKIHRYCYKPIYTQLSTSNDEQKINWKYWGEVSEIIFSKTRLQVH